MKSHFAPILKVKKQELDERENEIIKINQHIKEKFDLIAQFQRQMQELLLPSQGTLQDFKILQEHKNAFLFQIDRMHLEISMLKEEKKQKQELYQQAYIAYEKIHYLHTKELKKQQFVLKKSEEKYFDAIATTLFSLKEHS